MKINFYSVISKLATMALIVMGFIGISYAIESLQITNVLAIMVIGFIYISIAAWMLKTEKQKPEIRAPNFKNGCQHGDS